MSARVPQGFTETILHFSCPGQDGDVITAFGWGGSIDTQQEQEAAVAAISEIMGNLSTLVELVRVDFRIGSAQPDDPVVPFDTSVFGEAQGDMLPINNAYLIQKRSTLGGRRHRGRNYLPGVTEGAVNAAGAVSPAVQGGIQANVNTMMADMMTAGPWEPRIFHQSPPYTPTVVSTMNVSGVIATMRGRLSRS